MSFNIVQVQNTASITGTVYVGNPAAAIKSGSTAAVASDQAVVVAISPNNTVSISQSNVPSGTRAVTGSVFASIISGSGPISVSQSNFPGGTQPVSGTRTSNTAVPGATNVGVLAAIATSASVVVTEGNMIGLSTDNTGNLRVVQQVTDRGGASIYRVNSAATTNLANIKSGSANVYGWYIFNTNASTRVVKLYNLATAPTTASSGSILLTIPIPGGGGSNIWWNGGVSFGTGLGIGMFTGVADTDTTAVGANDLIASIFYK